LLVRVRRCRHGRQPRPPLPAPRRRRSRTPLFPGRDGETPTTDLGRASSIISDIQKLLEDPWTWRSGATHHRAPRRHGTAVRRRPDFAHPARPSPATEMRPLAKPPRHCPFAIVPVNGAGTVACRQKRAAGPVAQWLEPAAHNGLVAGSSPAGPTKKISNIPSFVWPERDQHQKPHQIHAPSVQLRIAHDDFLDRIAFSPPSPATLRRIAAHVAPAGRRDDPTISPYASRCSPVRPFPSGWPSETWTWAVI
jgi:hypothetical protein